MPIGKCYIHNLSCYVRVTVLTENNDSARCTEFNAASVLREMAVSYGELQMERNRDKSREVNCACRRRERK